jgi:hypothetical protein
LVAVQGHTEIQQQIEKAPAQKVTKLPTIRGRPGIAPESKKVGLPHSVKALIFVGLMLAASPARIGQTASIPKWGPLVEEILSHLATHMTYEGAQRLIEHLAQGGRVTPTLKDVIDEQLQKMITE